MSSTSVNMPQVASSRSMPSDVVNTLNEKIKKWDLFMCFDVFYLVITWLFLVGQKDKDIVFSANTFTWYVSLVFLLDLMFRLLAFKLENMHPEQWNHLWLCLFPVVFSMLAASYEYDRAIYGSKPLQVWNALFYTFYMIGVIVCAIYRRFM